jgi:hypothetical protein
MQYKGNDINSQSKSLGICWDLFLQIVNVKER